MNGVRLSPEEAEQFLAVAKPMDDFVAGARALAEHMKRSKIDELLAARPALQKEEKDAQTTTA